MFHNITVPYDPIIDVIAEDVKQNPALQQQVQKMRSPAIVHRNTIHPSDELLDAWYRFKENRTCQPQGDLNGKSEIH